ncbi:glycerophosphodiester phosphodiesterase [Streptomyces sp. SID2119]|uniref:glycerophosphodiester phosphodiesterase n=1 Tax=Streptomyces sp. SID2119 TaxID=2690253 RepID=UPI001369593E|nr:glycerophosphodiester phosphodiesterase [Streptomyces sp. SID2119]MYW28316.1 glycerophosphodiester phosphodiesterase [Streptomyces sp. SID2119]
MALPAGLATVTLTGRYIRPDGTPLKGTVTIATPALLTLPNADTISAGSATATLDAEGMFSLKLISTDQPDMQPSQWAYTITEKFQDIATRTYSIQLPSTFTTVSIADIAPADPSQGQYVIVPGPPGPKGTSILTGVGAPSPLLGGNGDSYIDTTPSAVKLYGPKAGGVWPSTSVSLGGAGGLISSVNTKTGDVVLTASDVGADPAGAATAAGATAKSEAKSEALATAAATYLPRAIHTVAALTSQSLFYIAHRGSGAELGAEHTLDAYEAAVAAGVRAIEVSVRMTADGVLVCGHDESLERTTYSTGNFSDWNYGALRAKVRTNGRLLFGQGTVDVPPPTLREVLDRFLGRVVIFLEPKSNASVPATQQLLTDFYPHAKDSVVWKNYYTNNSFPWAKTNGFTTWGYVDANTTDEQLNTYAANIDMWGVPIAMSDARITAVVSRGKPVICWEVHRRSERNRLQALGVKGMMCAQVVYVRRTGASRTSDDWATQVRAPGDMGTVNYDHVTALKFDDAGGSVFINALPNRSVLLGSLSNPTPPTTYTINFSMMYEGAPGSTEHAGIAFGKDSDDSYRFNQINSSGGYHIAVRGNGDLQLYTHTAGVTSGTQLGTVASAAPTAGQWMTFTVQVTPTQVILTRTDLETPVVLTVTNSAHRGGYMHLSNGSISSLANKPHWKSFSITA